LQTNPDLQSFGNHTFGKMLKNKLSTTFCTDNRTVSKTTVTDEILLALKNFPISKKTFRNCIIQGFKRGFFPGDYLSKRKYVRQCIDYYEKVTKGAEDFLLT
jgi:adenosine deaminase